MARGLIAIGAALALASPALAQTPIIDAAANSARGRTIYIHPGTSSLTPPQARRLEAQIEAEGRGPIYIAILPAAARREADGTALGVANELNRRVFTTNPPAVHAVLVGNELQAVNRDIPAGMLATRAFLSHRDQGVFAVLSNFVHRVGDARRPRASVARPQDDADGFPYGLLGVGLAVTALAASLAYWRARR